MEKGLIHIYTGTGKGKTTSAVGLAARALGQGFHVVYSHFMKNPKKYGYHEIDSLKKLGAMIMGFTEGHPFCDKSLKTETLQQQVKDGLKELTAYLNINEVDLLIMDEILITVRDGFLDEEELINFVKSKPKDTELVMTGRGATEKLIDLADYVSEVNKVKHPFDRGIMARRGIEF